MTIPTRLISHVTRGKMLLPVEASVIYRLWKQHAKLLVTMTESRVDVSVKEGRLRGVVEDNVDGGKFCAFRGIPYAKAPVNELRFKDPEPVESWNDIRDASKFGDNCAQKCFVRKQLVGSDDCLYLNVYTSDLKPPTKRAVMVFIHGGGFVGGSGDDDLYGADYLVKKDVVLVTINYRVGVLGFLNLEHEVAPGNQGLKDQVMALRWIKENISNFGGDPTNITIFGESAGGASVHYLTLSPLADGLFHKAISQSGVVVNPWAHLIKNPKRFGYELAAKLGLNSDNPQEVVNFLRTVEVLKLVDTSLRLTTKEENMQLISSFGPGIDDKSPNPFLTQPPQIAMRAGVKVPYLLGYNIDEGLFISETLATGGKKSNRYKEIDENFSVIIHPTIMETLQRENTTVEKLRNRYFGNKQITEELELEYTKLLGDMHFVHGIYEVVQIQCKNLRTPTYFYRFCYDSGTSLTKLAFNITSPGATHADDLPYLFNMNLIKSLNMEPYSRDSTQYKILQYFTTMWTNFAKTGNPTPTTTELIPVIWKPVDDGSYYNFLNIDEKLEMKTCKKGEQRCEWKNIKNKL